MSHGHGAVSMEITIHTVNLQKQLEGTFLLAWHCGRHHSGQTNRQLASDGYLTFEHKFAITLSASKFRHKICKVKLSRFYKSSKGQIYARCEFGLFAYASALAPVHVQIPMDTTHSSPPVLSMTILVTERDKDSADVVDSTSDVSDLTTDHASSWDMSSSCTPTDFHDFVARRKAARAALVRLGDMTRVSARPKPPLVKLPKAAKKPAGKELAQFLSREKTDTLTAADRLAIVQRAEELLPAAASFVWCHSPLDLETCPPAAAIFAVLIHSAIFDPLSVSEQQFRSLFVLFMHVYAAKKFVRGAASTDFLTVTAFLIKALKLPENGADHARARFVIDELLDFAAAEIDTFAGLLVRPLAEVATELMAPAFSIDRAFFVWRDRFRSVTADRNLYPSIQKLLEERVVELFDQMLVQELLNHPNLLSYMNCAAWKPLASQLESGGRIWHLVLFDEATSVILLSGLLCQSKESCLALCGDICGNLPKQIVLRLLKSQVPDEASSALNDTAAFEAAFEEELKVDAAPLTRPIRPRLESAIETISAAKWKGAAMPGEAFAAFDFLSVSFNKKE
jgi:hypothetical protein